MRGLLRLWAVLQVGAALALLAMAALLAGLGPLFGAAASGFLASWAAAFVVVPLTFVPVLAAWHRWAERRFGRRPGLFRLVAELSFAAELIGALLHQRIA